HPLLIRSAEVSRFAWRKRLRMRRVIREESAGQHTGNRGFAKDRDCQRVVALANHSARRTISGDRAGRIRERGLASQYQAPKEKPMKTALALLLTGTVIVAAG